MLISVDTVTETQFFTKLFHENSYLVLTAPPFCRLSDGIVEQATWQWGIGLICHDPTLGMIASFQGTGCSSVLGPWKEGIVGACRVGGQTN